ncbi:MAG TPA: hypothetical protein VIX17_11615 [Pyrinomonadaceae bacterium]|jgi:hypothetical protein
MFITINSKPLDLVILDNRMSLQHEGKTVSERLIGGPGDLNSLISDAHLRIEKMEAEDSEFKG